MGCILILHLESINEVNHYILKAKCAMQIRNFFLVFIVICLFEVAGCSNNIGNDEQTVEVQKRVGDNIYEDLNVVTDNNEVLQVKKILKDTHFENKKVGSFVKEPAFCRILLSVRNSRFVGATTSPSS
jgi:hypothetical protein